MIRTKTDKLAGLILSLLMILSTSCSKSEDAEVRPAAVIKGIVFDNEENPIQHICVKISFSDKSRTVYTSSDGTFNAYLSDEDLEDSNTFNITLSDIDGEDNGGLFETHTDIIIINMEMEERPVVINCVYHCSPAIP